MNKRQKNRSVPTGPEPLGSSQKYVVRRKTMQSEDIVTQSSSITAKRKRSPGPSKAKKLRSLQDPKTLSSYVDKDEMLYKSLHMAAGKGDETAVCLLLESKADVNAKEAYGGTALHWAAWSGREAVVQMLLEHKAD